MQPLPRTLAEAHLYYHPLWENSRPGWQTGDLMEGRGALLKDVELDPPLTVYPHGPFLAPGYGVIGSLSIGELICPRIMWTVLQEKCGTYSPNQALMLTSPVSGYGRVEMRGATITSWMESTEANDMVRVTNVQLKMAELIDHA
jgi:hypothetical protein